MGDEYILEEESAAMPFKLPQVISVNRSAKGRGAMVAVHSLEAVSPGTRSPGRHD